MNNAALLKSPAEARQPAWLRTEPLISLAGKHNTAFAQKQSSSLICYSAGLPIHMQGCVTQGKNMAFMTQLQIRWNHVNVYSLRHGETSEIISNNNLSFTAGEARGNGLRVWYTLKTRDWDGLIRYSWEDKLTKKQADYSEIKIFAWKYEMSHGLSLV